MENGELPLEIVDRKNERFLKIADLSSELKDSTGQLHSAARFVIYRNANKNRKKQFDKYGQRIFSPRVYPELSTLRIEAPEFNNPNAWSDRLGCFVIKGRGEGVDVGPGYNNVNVLTQRFNVIPNEHLLISTRARSISGTAKGRIQVNWINEKEQFLSSEIAVFQVDTSDEDFQKSVTVPANAKWGIVYVTPHDQGGHLHYSFLRIMGYTLLK
ncbi:hypothetical protein AGMMS50256_29750 [Betaproteobacteria bacterium]|nr:hypothetical protein AGMMS50256_29750 [Betaproteobacteria bacterium]